MLIIKRILVIVVGLIISFLLLGFTSSPKKQELHHEQPVVDVKVAYEEKIKINDTLNTPKVQEEKQTIEPTQKPSPSEKKANIAVYEITHYTSKCNGCTGITSSGYDVKNSIYYDDYRIVAAPKTIPFYTKMNITYEDGTTIKAIVLDRGGAIKSNRLDLLVEDKNEAYRLGRQNVTVEIIE